MSALAATCLLASGLPGRPPGSTSIPCGRALRTTAHDFEPKCTRDRRRFDEFDLDGVAEPEALARALSDEGVVGLVMSIVVGTEG